MHAPFGTAVVRAAWIPVLAIAAALPSGCQRAAAAPRPARVFAAASLTRVFRALATEFAVRHPEWPIELHFAGTPQLVLQLREGAPADVFAAADESNMQRVVRSGRTAGVPEVFARNTLTIVTARGNPRGVRELADLGRTDLRVVLCGPHVPAGRYARQALRRAGVEVRPRSDEPSVNSVVSKVALGEADAGVVYRTDATAAHDRVEAVAIPAARNVVGGYPIAVLRTGPNRAVGQRFVAFVRSAVGQSILGRFGFLAP
ncbi:MAG: molybdate ABC transporter substrate-binding protein [Planctomycetes bacterium]|nr:molybdate ABC transporter substrate-binding protein [Planctomycetota bacterium]